MSFLKHVWSKVKKFVNNMKIVVSNFLTTHPKLEVVLRVVAPAIGLVLYTHTRLGAYILVVIAYALYATLLYFFADGLHNAVSLIRK